MNLDTFVKTYKYSPTKDEMIKRPSLKNGRERIMNYYPTYSARKGSGNFIKFLQYELIKYRVWEGEAHSAWDSLSDDQEDAIRNCYKEFIHSHWALNNLSETIRNVIDIENIEPVIDDDEQNILPRQLRESWQILCESNPTRQDIEDTYDWSQDAKKYPYAFRNAEAHLHQIRHEETRQRRSPIINVSTFSRDQAFAYKLINKFCLNGYIFLNLIFLFFNFFLLI